MGGESMTSNENDLYDYIKKNDGFITFREIKENGISYNALKKLVNKGDIEIEEQGIYRFSDVYVDDYFNLQYRFPKGIYSLETALWLHELSDTVPFEPKMTFPYGTNTKNIKNTGISPIVVRSFYQYGVTTLERQKGQKIYLYDKERTLAECLRTHYDIDIQIIAPAFRKYFISKQIDIPKLIEYAKVFKVEAKLQSYIEVLT